MASSSSCKSSNTILLALIVFLSISLSSADAQFVDYCIADEQAAEDVLGYYQNMKHNGGSCYFTAAAVLTCLDPSKQTP
ncbi:hypothetical protein ACS0TY_032829 [Phlomoides rotata]